MQFFKKSDPTSPEQPSAQPTSPRFGAKSSVVSSSPPEPQRGSRGSLFSRHRSGDSISASDKQPPQASNTRTSLSNMFRRDKHEDPDIAAARERVVAAEKAEEEADIALQQARHSARDARDHVNRLVAETEAEAKAARLKQGQAQDLDRRAQPLGRHDRF